MCAGKECLLGHFLYSPYWLLPLVIYELKIKDYSRFVFKVLTDHIVVIAAQTSSVKKQLLYYDLRNQTL